MAEPPFTGSPNYFPLPIQGELEEVTVLKSVQDYPYEKFKLAEKKFYICTKNTKTKLYSTMSAFHLCSLWHFSGRVAALAFLLLGAAGLAGQSIVLKPTLHSIGYQIQLPPGYDDDSTAHTQVRYRTEGQSWQPGFPAARLSLAEFRGSLFQLAPATTYELEVRLVDSFPVFSTHLLTATATTAAIPQIQPGGVVRWVSPEGSGTAYSEANPGNLRTLLAGGLSCGTTVLLKGGSYRLGDLTLHLTEDCPDSAPIVLMAAPGETPILDGGSYTHYTWHQGDGDTTIWWTNLPAHLNFNAMCIVDGERMYPYAFLTPSGFAPSYPSLWTLGYGLSGFYRDRFNRVFIKTLDGRNINHSQVVFSQQSYCLTVYGNHKNVHLRIKGIHFKYYGKGRCDWAGSFFTCHPANTLRFEDASHVVVDSCSFEFCNFPVIFEGNCSNNIVMNCRITDGTGYWSHAAFKRTVDVFPIFIDSNLGSWGRYLENIGIHFRPHPAQTVQGNIAWNNTVQGVVVGIGLGFANGSVMSECDISGNTISWCFDGIDAIGEHRNVRIWDNKVGHCPVGVSLISTAQKPAYVFRNVFHHLDQRQNYHNDPSFVNCNGNSTLQSWSTALKLNAGDPTDNNDLIYFIHNTVHGTAPFAFNLYLWQPTWKVLQLRNNIFYAEGEANFFFDQVQNQPAYSFESIGDNIVNPSAGVLGIVRAQGNCLEYNTPEALEQGLSAATGSPWIGFDNSSTALPYFSDPDHCDFRLTPASPLIDRGVIVPGFNNHYAGLGPDIGAFEWPDSLVSAQRPVFLKDAELTIFPNPAQGVFFARFTPKNGKVHLQVWDAQGRLWSERDFSGLSAASQTMSVNISPLPPGVYFLRFRFGDEVVTKRLVVK